ncbi:MFS transporter [Pseudonocardia xinjiangensis]|uniref:MFS transporter n=1 Tax=Pseudonocardia xinjiangensis TaxID=75289 RepID=UPI003D944B08
MSTQVAAEPATRAAPAPSGELTHRQVLTILVGLALGMFLAALDQTVVSTAIRTIADDLGGLSLQAWATTAFLITGTITTPLYGKLSDIYGRKPLFLTAITIFIVGSVLCTFSQSMYELAAFRAVQGLGAGGLFSLALTILGDIVPPRERARYQGYILAVFGTSSVLGPVIGGVLSGQTTILGIDGWRWIFLVNVPIGAVALIVVARVLTMPHIPRPHRIDWPGAIMLAVFLVPLLIVAEQGREWGWDSTRSLVCYAIGLVGLVLFLVAERHYGDDALIPLRLFRNSVFALSAAAGIVIGAGMFGGISLLPQFLQIVHGATPTEAGFLTLPLVAGIMISSIVSGQITSRTGRYKIFPIIGVALMVGAMLLMHFRVNVDIPLWELDLYMLMFGLGLGLSMQTLVLAVQNAVPARDMGVATASTTFFRQLGGTIGVAIFLSIVFSTVTGNISDEFRKASTTPQFQAALADPAVRANPVNQPVIAALSGGGDGGASSVLNDSSFLQQIDARLARPFLAGFSDSMTATFLIVAFVLMVAFVLVLFIKELPLRTMSGAQARAMEDAGLAEAGPAGSSMSAEGATAQVTSSDAAHTPAAQPDMASRAAAYNTATHNGSGGRHALMSQDTTPLAAAVNGNGNGHAPANGHHVPDAVPAPVHEQTQATQVPGYPAAAGMPADRPATDNGPAVYGTVSRSDGLGLPQVVVTVADPAGRQEARTTTGHDGYYRVDLRTGGTYLVVAAAGTYQPHAAMVAVGGTPARHDVALSGSSGVVGTVRTPDLISGTRAVAGAAVTLIDARGDVAAARVTDADGRFQLVGVPDGSYTLTAASPGHQPVAVSVQLAVGATIERDLELPRRSRLLGTVTAASNGRGVAEAMATLVDATGTVVGSAVTGPDGSFTFEDLAEGTYTLTASGYAPVAQVVHISAGAQASTVVQLGAPNPANQNPAGQNPAGQNPAGPNAAPPSEHLFEPFDAGGVR